jgi:hypothetical protein
MMFEYKNMTFEKGEDGVWIHKDWALPGDFGDVFEKPASQELQKKVEAAYQDYQEEKSYLDSKTKSIKPFKVKKDVALDFTKTLTPEDKKSIKKEDPKPIKKSELRGFFNPFKQGTLV